MVLVIVGVIVTFSVIGVRFGQREDQVELEVRRLAALVTLARDEAVLNAEELGMAFTRTGYVFLRQRLVGDATYEWRPVTDDAQLRRRQLGELQPSLTLAVSGAPVALPDDDATPAPQVLFDPSGRVTPFELRVAVRDGNHTAFRLGTARDGRFTAERL